MYKATAADPKDAAAAASTEGLSGKQVKKQARAAARKAVFVEGAEQLMRVRVPSGHILKAYYVEELDALVCPTPSPHPLRSNCFTVIFRHLPSLLGEMAGLGDLW